MSQRADDGTSGVSASIVGGLGNQLFIYAAALAQARRLGAPLTLMSDDGTEQAAAEFELSSFEHEGIVASARPAPGRVARRLRALGRADSQSFTEASFEYDPRIESVTSGVHLTGYFQSWRYFETVQDELRTSLTAPAPSSWLRDWSDRIDGEPGTIALHVRRGDYTRPETAAFHGLTSTDYYRRSLDLLHAAGVEGTLVVFSDQPSVASAELDSLGDLLIVDDQGSPLVTMRLMARCDARVMANSSFSWWAAWIAEPARQPVIAPRPWFAHRRYDTRDLLLPRWVTLDHRSFS